MKEPSQSAFNALLLRARDGDAPAVSELFSLVYEQLKQIAHAQRIRQREDTLNTTALVHEAFVKLARHENLDVRDRSHFMAVAATAMRHVLIDHARARLAGKRGGGVAPASLQELEVALANGAGFDDGKAEVLLALDQSISRLAQRYQRQSRVV
jgi:RNA polymerase sigma factor (TIGR02999 family)